MDVKMEGKAGKIFITGTGRAGTTFLMKLFIHLGYNTGYTPITMLPFIYPGCNSGLERPFRAPPRILKNPEFCYQIDAAIKSKIHIAYVIVPIRDYKEAAQSRVRYGHSAGGLWRAANSEES